MPRRCRLCIPLPSRSQQRPFLQCPPQTTTMVHLQRFKVRYGLGREVCCPLQQGTSAALWAGLLQQLDLDIQQPCRCVVLCDLLHIFTFSNHNIYINIDESDTPPICCSDARRLSGLRLGSNEMIAADLQRSTDGIGRLSTNASSCKLWGYTFRLRPAVRCTGCAFLASSYTLLGAIALGFSRLDCGP